MQNEKEVLLAELHEKMEREMKQYEVKLLAMPPERILEEAYQYTIYREISCLMEESDLNARQLRALLKSENPMAEIYARWLDTDISFSEELGRLFAWRQMRSFMQKCCFIVSAKIAMSDEILQH